MDEGESENDQVEVATLQVSLLFPCWQNERRVTNDPPFLLRGKGEKRKRGEEKEVREGRERS